MKVNLFCRFNQTGIGRHAENFYRAMESCAAERFSIRSIDPDSSGAAQQLIDATGDNDFTIFFTLQYAALAADLKGRKIIWLAFESNRFPTQWRDLLTHYDAIWVPSAWGRDVLISSGVAAQKICVIMEGVDTAIYNPKPVAHNGFVFLSVGKYEKRKSINECIRAFLEEFPVSEYADVFLKLKADFPMFPERVQALKTSLAIDPRIEIADGHKSDAEMAVLYNSADAFLFPSRAEGFGLPCIEALACGVPILATFYSGQTEYLKEIEGYYLPIAYEMEDIQDHLFDHFFKEVYAGEVYGQWAKPDITSLRQSMRQIYTQRDEYKAKALQASEIIRQKFDWSQAAKKAVTEIFAF